jgi:hypothetical protein
MFIISLLFCSCEEVIELNLDNDTGKIVIDAKLVAPDGECTVIISKSIDYYETINKEYINTASVKLVNTKTNQSYNIDLKSDGTYTANIDIEYETTYQLEVSIDNTKYTASSYLHSPAKIRAIKFEEDTDIDEDEKIDDRPIYKALCLFDDIKSVNNYYRCILHKNGERASSLFYLVDDNRDATNEFKVSLGSDGGESDLQINQLHIDDDVKIELLTLDKSTYEYYEMLNLLKTEGGEEPDAPGNPKGNFTNNALGYFGAFHTDYQELKVSVE